MQNIAIIDYGMGNINSVKRQLERLGVNAIVSSNVDVILKADKIILPGVGHFNKAMENLEQLNLLNALVEFSLVQKKPTLGICLGMELMAKFSEEGNAKGLGWFDADVVKINSVDPLRFKIPHVGWNTINIKKDSPLNIGLDKTDSFYFVHSYKVVAHQIEDILHTTNYESDFTAAISKDNIFGVQFHPEKSQDAGLQIFKNFIGL